MERGGTDEHLTAHSAVEEFEHAEGIPVLAIATLSDLLQYLDSGADPALSAHRPAVGAYRERYGTGKP
jgi:orotate phosphoribosyltransferase